VWGGWWGRVWGRAGAQVGCGVCAGVVEGLGRWSCGGGEGEGLRGVMLWVRG